MRNCRLTSRKISGGYQVQEKRSASYALLDLDQLKQQTKVSDDELKAYYQQNIDQFKVQNRVHVEHILFKTVGRDRRFGGGDAEEG